MQGSQLHIPITVPLKVAITLVSEFRACMDVVIRPRSGLVTFRGRWTARSVFGRGGSVRPRDDLLTHASVRSQRYKSGRRPGTRYISAMVGGFFCRHLGSGFRSFPLKSRHACASVLSSFNIRMWFPFSVIIPPTDQSVRKCLL